MQEQIERVLEPLTNQNYPFALLDFPMHPNVGDSAIWVGEIAYFRRFHTMRPTFVNHCHSNRLDQLSSIVPKGTIFIHGGGNFGDLWPHHQKHREDVLRRFPDRKVVQLPQSIHFASHEAVSRSESAINQHKDFTLLVRDEESFDFASQHYRCKIQVCPDMAFMLGVVERPAKASLPLLLLLRTDSERKALDQTNIPPYASVCDWLTDDPHMTRRMMFPYMHGLFDIGSDAFNSMHRLETRFRLRAEARLKRGLTLLASANHVITDRLHVHILCLLLGIPHTVLDNSYGKLSRFINRWTREAAGVYQAGTLADAISHYESLRMESAVYS